MDEELPVAAVSERDRDLQELLASYDAPAYVRRARGVEGALARLIDACRHQRDKWLAMARLRLGQLHALAGGWANLRPVVADDADLAVLEGLYELMRPELRVPLAPTTRAGALRRALRALVGSLDRFNARWREHLAKLDLTEINALRDGYNRYYLLEKECALRSPTLARRGFQPLPPLRTADVAAEVPPLPVPRLAGAD